MTKKEIEDFLQKVEGGLSLAHQEMLKEKALHDQFVVIADDKGDIVRIPAKEVLESKVHVRCRTL